MSNLTNKQEESTKHSQGYKKHYEELFGKLLMHNSHSFEKQYTRENMGRLELYQEILKNNSDDITLMMTISENMATCEQGFSCMNSQKQTSVHNFQKTLNNIILLSYNSPSVDQFDTSPQIMSWISNNRGTGKRHKEHNTNQSKHKNEKKESIKKEIKRK